MAKRRLAVVGIVGLVAAGVAAYALDPDARLKGWAAGEPFFGGRAASAWANRAGSTDPNARAAAGNELTAGGAAAVPVLVVMLRADGPPEPRQVAADVLGRIGKPDALPAGDALVAALDDPDPIVRTVAIKALVRLAPDVDAVPALVRRFPDPDAIRAVSAFKPSAAPAVPDLIALLTHADPTVRWNATRTLGKLDDVAAPAIPGIVAQLGDPDPTVREYAAQALGDLGPSAASGIPALVRALGDPVPKVRYRAVEALGKMGAAARGVLSDVRRMAADPDKEVSAVATRAARLIDPSLSAKK